MGVGLGVQAVDSFEVEIEQLTVHRLEQRLSRLLARLPASTSDEPIAVIADLKSCKMQLIHQPTLLRLWC